MKKALTLAIIVVAVGIASYFIYRGTENNNSYSPAPVWLESDSLAAIQARIERDFSFSRQELAEALSEKYPDFKAEEIDKLVANHYLEALTINGEQRFFRKSVRNLGILAPEYGGTFEHRGSGASEARISYVDSVLNFYEGKNDKGLSHEVLYRFSVDVPGDSALVGDTLRVWMPVPLSADRCSRQSNVKILNAMPADYILSGDRSVHNTIYFEAPAPAPGDTAHFEYTASFITSGQYMSEKDILNSLQAYDKEADVYKTYTAFENRHIVPLDSLAREIVGDESNPFRQSELVYNYIINTFPWAGAREYSTLDCIPRYVLEEKHGDCGQVSLLYISLMRTLGVPARWESGWMLHPGELNLHDWAEVYFEGIGWLPVDVSFGRYTNSGKYDISHFYSHGMDAHRFASNKGVGGELFPAKKYLRSETVDFQLGEVECGKGNLYYPAWDSKFELISSTPIKRNSK